jgi:hypothetical protein
VQAPVAALHPPAGQELIATDVEQPAVALTHAPLHRANPFAQTEPHAPATHVDSALATLLAQALPQPEQLVALLVVSTHVLEHSVGAVEGQLATQAKASPEPVHKGVLPAHLLPQLPQLETLDGSTQPSGHASWPAPQSGRGTPASEDGFPLSTAEVASTVVLPPSRHSPEHVPEV